ncbi:MAG: Crp/Fnr family transcriptional regulator [Alphaproteobacteria bacterium]|nr:Crp/Fnr family transcriptional regulator [Alphaproteobacteria bacterium]
MTCQNNQTHQVKSSREQHYPLDTLDFFAAFPADLLKKLHDSGRRVSYTKGQVLFTQDDPAEWFYMIESGWVKLFRETLDGDEVILDVLPAGYVFGETTMFENGAYPYGAEIVEAGDLTAYPVALLADCVRGNGDLALAMLQHIATKNMMKDREIEHRTIMNAPQRIGCFLLRLCKVKQTPPVVLHLPYDKTLIASRLGMQPETFSRALTRLQQDTGIKIKGATVEIDNMGKLITYTCTACSNVFPCDNE